MLCNPQKSRMEYCCRAPTLVDLDRYLLDTVTYTCTVGRSRYQHNNMLRFGHIVGRCMICYDNYAWGATEPYKLNYMRK